MKVLLILLSLIVSFTYGQQPGSSAPPIKTTPINIGEIQNINSKILNETRFLNVYLPPGYDTSSTDYPVLYVMDGSLHEDFIHIVGLVQFLNMYELMPETIVVGVTNVDRKRDFTFPTSIKEDKIDFPTTGGSENFINFLSKEAIPYIDALYRTNETKTIIGQSLGGLLATEIFLKHTDMFNQYIIVSPSLWWDKESLLEVSNPKLSKTTRVYVSVGKEGKIMQRDAKALANKIQKVSGDQLKVDFSYLPKENHATILHQAAYLGFRSLYEN
jgi:predicted alpha/beta superfamily hydrolase